MSLPEKTCLVLGGGGARGLSHLGALEVLDREGLRIDCIVGTSAGALVGAAYALQPNAAAILGPALEYFRETVQKGGTMKKVLFKSEDAERNIVANIFSSIRKGYVFSALLRKPAIFPSAYLEEIIAELVPDKDFMDTQIPFAVPALDVRKGEDVLIREGSLRAAVLASCSLPGFFPPVERDGRLLVDAGVIGPVPVLASRVFDPTVTIAIDISSRLEHITEIDQGLDAIMRVEAIACGRLNDIELAEADIVIRPDVGEQYWSDFSGLGKLVQEGAEAAERQIEAIRALAKRASRPPPPRPVDESAAAEASGASAEAS